MEYTLFKLQKSDLLTKRAQVLPPAVLQMVSKAMQIPSGQHWELIKRIHTIIKEAGFKIKKTSTSNGTFGKHNFNFYFTAHTPINGRPSVKGGKLVLGCDKVIYKYKANKYFVTNHYCSLYVSCSCGKRAERTHTIPVELPETAILSVLEENMYREYGIPTDINLASGKPEWSLQTVKGYASIECQKDNKILLKASDKLTLTYIRRQITR